MTIEPLESRRLFTAYFVDAARGNDSLSGRSARTAWQTLAAVNNHAFHPGDKILLTGTFSGQTLSLGPNATGVSVNSYRTNPARTAMKIGAANAAVLADVIADGIDITTSNVTVQNINIQAAPSAVATGNYNYGVYLHNSTAAMLMHEVINHITATGFSYSGLCMQGWNMSAADSAGFSNLLIENSVFHANQVSGIFVAAGDSTGNEFQPEFPGNLYLNSNLTIKNCQTYDNAGFNPALNGIADGNQVNSGNSTSGGIFISSVSGALVENCTAYNNSFASNTIHILNNIFFSSGSAVNVLVTAPEPSVQIDRNDYWVAGAADNFSVNFNGNLLGSAADWSSTSGYEMLFGKSVAIVQDPMLGNELVSDLPTPASLELRRISPLRSQGLNLTSPPWRAEIGNIGKVNFFGRPINQHSVGAG